MPHASNPLQIILALGQTTWISVGSFALAVLGIHRSAERVDDVFFEWVAHHALPVETEALRGVSIGLALACELSLSAWLAWVLIRSRQAKDSGKQALLGRVCPGWLAALLCWGPITAAGSWSVSMVLQDHIAPWSDHGAAVVGTVVGVLVFFRLGVPGWAHIALRAPAARRRTSGWFWAPLAAAMAVLAVRHGLPIWGGSL